MVLTVGVELGAALEHLALKDEALSVDLDRRHSLDLLLELIDIDLELG